MRNIVLLGIVSLLTDVSTEMVYPLLPLYLASLGSGPAILGLIEGAAESTASLLRVFSGYISDRLRRRRILAIAGYGGSTIGKVFLALATAWGMVLAGRLVDRFGKGIRTAPRDALIADSSPPDRRGRAFGLHRAMDTLGAALGVVVALCIISFTHSDIRTVILISIVPAAAAVGILFLVREPRSAAATPGEFPRFRMSHISPQLRNFLGISLLFTLGNSSNTFLLLHAAGSGIGTADVLLLYLAYNSVYALASYPAGRLSDRVGRKGLLIGGYLAYALVYAGFALLPLNGDFWLYFPLFCLYGLYSANTEGVAKALVADLATTEYRATAIGLHAGLEGIGLLPASLLAGQLWANFGPSAPFLFGSVTAALAALLLALLLRHAGR